MITDQFEAMLEQSGGHPLVFGISLHTFVAGQPIRLQQIEQALEHVVRHSGFHRVWVTVPDEITKYVASLPSGVMPGSV